MVKAYYKILSPDYPKWIDDYIATPPMQRLSKISVTSGSCYSKLFPNSQNFSSLDHSIAVALIIWHFTHDQKQSLAGLFHDIATPAFKHSIDFLNGDHLKQESTEESTSKIISNSPEIMKLLSRDNITLSEVDNYHIYPIADNDTPRLSADRLEYSLSNALFIYPNITIGDAERFYQDIKIDTDENGTPEMSFKTKQVARDFVRLTSKLSIIYRNKAMRFSMQFMADILRKLIQNGKITRSDFYRLSEKQIIKIIQSSQYADVFNSWQEATRVSSSATEPKAYFVHQAAKIRYIDPLCNGQRMSRQCKLCQKSIAKNLAYDMEDYVYIAKIPNFLEEK